MIVALIDNGSVVAAAHRQLRDVAAELSTRTGVPVEAVSWKHSQRVPTAELDGTPAATLQPWLRAHLARGEREFLFVPYFISAQGAIGSALRTELEQIAGDEGGFTFAFSDGLAARGTLAPIVAERIRDTIARRALRAPAVIIVDHGGPSIESASLRDQVADEVRNLVGATATRLAAASMEGADHPHNQPLLGELLSREGFDRGDVLISPLFLAPGRHAGEAGDLSRIARAAEARTLQRGLELRCHFAALVGTHPLAVNALADALHEALTRRKTLLLA